jgi:hypothetical protein
MSGSIQQMYQLDEIQNSFAASIPVDQFEARTGTLLEQLARFFSYTRI